MNGIYAGLLSLLLVGGVQDCVAEELPSQADLDRANEAIQALIAVRDTLDDCSAFFAIWEAVELSDKVGFANQVGYYFRTVNAIDDYEFRLQMNREEAVDLRIADGYAALATKRMGTKAKRLIGLISSTPTIIVKDADTSWGEFLFRKAPPIAQMDPVDDLTIGANAFFSPLVRRGQIEGAYFERSKITEVGPAIGGRFVSKWKRNKGEFHSICTLTHSLSHDSLPVRLHLEYPNKPGVEREVTVEWGKHDQQWVPKKINLIGKSDWGEKSEPVEEHSYIVFHWKIGDKVPKSLLDYKPDNVLDSIEEAWDLDLPRYRDGKLEKPGKLFELPEGMEIHL